MQATQKSTTTPGAAYGTLRRATHAVGRLRRGRADERGLTTLEWLLIVAAVAGLAALAVVLVQNVVDDTAEQISGSSARGTAAQVAAERITREARAALPVGNNATAFTNDEARATAWVTAQRAVNQESEATCDRLAITYGDIGEGFDATWTPAVLATITDGTDADSDPNDAMTAGNQGSTSTHDGGATAVTGADRTEARCQVTIPAGS